MRALSVSVLLLCLLSACSTEPRIVSGTPNSVSYRLASGDVTQAREDASRYCGGFDKQSHLRQVVSEGGDTIATFNCE